MFHYYCTVTGIVDHKPSWVFFSFWDHKICNFSTSALLVYKLIKSAGKLSFFPTPPLSVFYNVDFFFKSVMTTSLLLFKMLMYADIDKVFEQRWIKHVWFTTNNESQLKYLATQGVFFFLSPTVYGLLQLVLHVIMSK